jgi:signal transduction histidine kinase
MKRIRKYDFLFGLTLLALAALGTWWSIFFMRSVELEKKAQLSELIHASTVTALMLGHGNQKPELGPLAGPMPLEIIAAESFEEGMIFAPAVPNFPQIGVRARPSAVAEIESKLQRRRFMLIGEGGLLVLLLAVLTFMLYRLAGQERRHMRRMEAFVASVSHEMKTPITGIKSMLQTFAEDRVPRAEAQRLFGLGIKEAERLEHMIENVLISGHLRRTGFQLQLQPIELRQLLEGFIEHRQRYLIEHPEAIQLDWQAERPDLSVSGDGNALHLVLENLTDNAFKYGGQTPQVTIRVTQKTETVEITVEDQGIGFSPEKAAKLFIPFKRALDEKAAAQHGTGLGLSIAFALARRMAGDLTAKSDGPGKGSRFTLSLREAGK